MCGGGSGVYVRVMYGVRVWLGWEDMFCVRCVFVVLVVCGMHVICVVQGNVCGRWCCGGLCGVYSVHVCRVYG
jgi:hypothetical protein